MNYLAAKGLRVCPIPDSAHPKWNDFGRAIDASDLRLSLLKGTCIVNHGRGPWGTHRFSYEAQEAAASLLHQKGSDFFEDLIPRIEYDTGISFTQDDDAVSSVTCLWAEGVGRRLKEEACLNDFRVWVWVPCWVGSGLLVNLGTGVVQNRCCPTVTPKAKNKAWFGIEQSFRALDHVWTILEETAMHAQGLLAKMKGLAQGTGAVPWILCAFRVWSDSELGFVRSEGCPFWFRLEPVRDQLNQLMLD